MLPRRKCTWCVLELIFLFFHFSQTVAYTGQFPVCTFTYFLALVCGVVRIFLFTSSICPLHFISWWPDLWHLKQQQRVWYELFHSFYIVTDFYFSRYSHSPWQDRDTGVLYSNLVVVTSTNVLSISPSKHREKSKVTQP